MWRRENSRNVEVVVVWRWRKKNNRNVVVVVEEESNGNVMVAAVVG